MSKLCIYLFAISNHNHYECMYCACQVPSSGIRVRAFRDLVCAGHKEFASRRQQDAHEFLLYLLLLVEVRLRHFTYLHASLAYYLLNFSLPLPTCYLLLTFFAILLHSLFVALLLCCFCLILTYLLNFLRYVAYLL